MSRRGFGLTELVAALFVSAALALAVLGALVFGAQRQRMRATERELTREATFVAALLQAESDRGAAHTAGADVQVWTRRLPDATCDGPAAATLSWRAADRTLRGARCCQDTCTDQAVVATDVTGVERSAQGHWTVHMSRPVGNRAVSVDAASR